MKIDLKNELNEFFWAGVFIVGMILSFLIFGIIPFLIAREIFCKCVC